MGAGRSRSSERFWVIDQKTRGNRARAQRDIPFSAVNYERQACETYTTQMTPVSQANLYQQLDQSALIFKLRVISKFTKLNSAKSPCLFRFRFSIPYRIFSCHRCKSHVAEDRSSVFILN